MIRKLSENDRAVCMELVRNKPAENLFIIGDIEAYGFDKDFQEIWGDFTEDNKLRAVLLRYNINFISYAEGDFDAKGFADIVNQNNGTTQLSGLEAITEAMIPYLSKTVKSKRHFFYAKCEGETNLPTEMDLTPVHKATINDINRIITLHSKIPEFSDAPRNSDSMKRSMEKGVARTFYVEENGQMVSSASTTAENTYAAMVVGVGTLENYKRKGYATKCLTAIAREVLDENKALCLFYDNPEAGRIYKKLGYVDIGKWTLISFDDNKGR